ncbi:MAG: ABC transporter substrate-binding protein [Tepidisphaerales bacterium]
MRIISLLPAATSIVETLGGGAELVAVSHACRPAHAGLTRLTRSRVPEHLDAAETDAAVRRLLAAGTPLFELDEATLVSLRPDVVLTQSLCEVCAYDGRSLSQRLRSDCPNTLVVQWSPTTLDDVVGGIGRIANAVGRPREGIELVRRMRLQLFDLCLESTLDGPAVTVVFLEWLEPLFCAGHWIPELVQLAGGRELLGRAGERSTPITPQQLLAADPDVLLVACCGWPAERSRASVERLGERPWWRRLRAVQSGSVYVLDAQQSLTQPDTTLVDAARMMSAVLRHARGRGAVRPREVASAPAAGSTQPRDARGTSEPPN